MNFLRGLVLLGLGLGLGVLLTPRIPQIQSRISAVVERVRSTARP